MQGTTYGFQQHLSIQDVLFLLWEEIIAPATHHSRHAILALHLKGAFDNLAHTAIPIGRLNETGCGERTYSYIADFLTCRSASHPQTSGSNI